MGKCEVRHERRNVPVDPGGRPGTPGQVAVPGGVQPGERARHPAGGKLDPRLQHEQLALSHHLGRAGYQGVQVASFILTAIEGNPHVIRYSSKYDILDSFNVMLARAEDPQNDILFTGDDHNTEGFLAWKRQID